MMYVFIVVFMSLHSKKLNKKSTNIFSNLFQISGQIAFYKKCRTFYAEKNSLCDTQ